MNNAPLSEIDEGQQPSIRKVKLSRTNPFLNFFCKVKIYLTSQGFWKTEHSLLLWLADKSSCQSVWLLACTHFQHHMHRMLHKNYTSHEVRQADDVWIRGLVACHLLASTCFLINMHFFLSVPTVISSPSFLIHTYKLYLISSNYEIQTSTLKGYKYGIQLMCLGWTHLW